MTQTISNYKKNYKKRQICDAIRDAGLIYSIWGNTITNENLNLKNEREVA